MFFEIPKDFNSATIAPAQDLKTNVHVYNFKITDHLEDLESQLKHLSQDEQDRFQTMHSSRKNAFLVSRYMLRNLLRSYLGHNNFHFEYSSLGRPCLSNSESGLQFNLSHSGERGVIAFSAIGHVGVDVEQIRPVRNVKAIADRLLTENEKKSFLKSGSENDEIFFRLWVCKEACVKALASGIFRREESVELSLTPQGTMTIARFPHEEPKKWFLHEFSPEQGYKGALSFMQW